MIEHSLCMLGVVVVGGGAVLTTTSYTCRTALVGPIQDDYNSPSAASFISYGVSPSLF